MAVHGTKPAGYRGIGRPSSVWGVVGMISAAVLVFGGCGGSPVPAGPTAGPGTSATKPGPVYSGPAFPGLAKQPVAHLDRISDDSPNPVGGSFVWVNLGNAGQDDPSGSTSASLLFYDAATGRKLASATVPFWDIKQPEVSDFNGTPAIFLHGVQTKPSDGLNPATTVEHEVGFDASGHKLVDSSWPGDDKRTTRAGWTMNQHFADPPNLVVYAPDGSARLTVPADAGDFGDVRPEVKDIVSGIAIVDRVRPGDSGNDHYLAAYDLAKPGDPLWTTDSARPAGVDGREPELAFRSGSLLGLLWPADSGKGVVSIQDVRTGSVKGATPPMDDDPGFGGTPSGFSEADNAQSGVAILEPGNSTSFAISLADAHVLWRQPTGQLSFTPVVVIGDTAYGITNDSGWVGTGNAARPSLAIKLATGTLIAQNMPNAPIAVTDNGYAAVPDDQNQGSFWIFRSDRG